MHAYLHDKPVSTVHAMFRRSPESNIRRNLDAVLRSYGSAPPSLLERHKDETRIGTALYRMLDELARKHHGDELHLIPAPALVAALAFALPMCRGLAAALSCNSSLALYVVAARAFSCLYEGDPKQGAKMASIFTRNAVGLADKFAAENPTEDRLLSFIAVDIFAIKELSSAALERMDEMFVQRVKPFGLP